MYTNNKITPIRYNAYQDRIDWIYEFIEYPFSSVRP